MQSAMNDSGVKVTYQNVKDHEVADFLNQFRAPIIEELGEKISTPTLKVQKKPTKNKREQTLFEKVR